MHTSCIYDRTRITHSTVRMCDGFIGGVVVLLLLPLLLLFDIDVYVEVKNEAIPSMIYECYRILTNRRNVGMNL